MAEAGPFLGARPPVKVLVAFAALGPLTIHVVLPALPHLQHQFRTDYASVQLLVSLYVVAFGGGQILAGMVSDVLGRRATLVAGLSLYAVACLLCVFALSIETVIALRVLQGLGACSGMVIARALVRDHYDDRQATRVLGYLAIGISIGPLVAPSLGGLIFEAVGWQGPFWFLAIFGAASALLAFLYIHDTPPAGSAEDGLRRLLTDVGLLLRDRDFCCYWLGVCFNAGAVFSFIVASPWVGTEFLGLTPVLFGLWYGLSAIGYAGGNYLAGRISDRFGRETIVLAGAVFVSVACAALVAVFATGLHSAPAVYGSYAAMMVASGFVMPNAYAGSMKSVPQAAGSASGFLGFGQYAVGAVFSTVATLLMEAHRDPTWLGAVMFGSSLGGVCTALYLQRADRAAPQREGT
jgi:DHA1 family bicyclomycin/chloramphenicol resistance-like MFS transporter